MSSSTEILLAAQDWVIASGIQHALKAAGHEVVLATGQSQLLTDGKRAALALIVTDGTLSPGANPAVMFCASHDVPVIWLLMSGNPESLFHLSSIRTVGVLVMPVHESQLLAAIGVGLLLAQRSTPSSAESSGSPRGGGQTTAGSQTDLLERLPLTTRQRDIVRMLLDGGRVSTIAESLSLSPATVRAHLNRIYARLGVHSQATLVRVVRTGSWPGSMTNL